MSTLRPTAPEFKTFKNGEAQAYRYYYDLHSAEVYRFILRMVHQTDEAEDILNNTFLALWFSRFRINDEVHLRYFLFATAENLCRASVRSTVRRQTSEKNWLRLVEADEDGMTEKEKMEVIKKQVDRIEKLSPRRKAMVRLRFYFGLGVKAIAALLEVDEQTVRNTINQAIDKLKEPKGHNAPNDRENKDDNPQKKIK